MKKIFMICAVLLAAVTAMAQDGTKYYGIKSGSYKTNCDDDRRSGALDDACDQHA